MTGLQVSQAYYKHLTCRMITMLRGVLVSAIFKKSIRMRHGDNGDDSAAVTLMSTDIDGIEGGLALFHDIWASVIELVLGVYLLATIVGGASFLVVLPGLGACPGMIESRRYTDSSTQSRRLLRLSWREEWHPRESPGTKRSKPGSRPRQRSSPKSRASR